MNLCRRRGRRDAFHAVIDRKTDGRKVEWREGGKEGKSQEKQEEARSDSSRYIFERRIQGNSNGLGDGWQLELNLLF